MNPIQKWASELRQLGVDFAVDQKQLRLDAPAGVLEPELVAALEARKSELLQFLHQESASSSSQSVIESVNHRSVLPLSHAQERLWFLDQLEGSSALYNMGYVVRLRGEVHLSSLERSLQEIVQRHAVLRTAIELDSDGQPLQRIGEQRLTLYQKNIANESALQLCVAEEKARTFDLSEELKIRATLISVSSGADADDSVDIDLAGSTESILVIVVHHIASDGWSMGVLRRELSAFYAAYSEGYEPELAPLAIQYADYAVWQRRWLDGEKLATQESYWREQLCGAPALLSLPSDYPRPAVQGFRGATHGFELSRGLSERLREFSRTRGATLYMTLMSALSVLLSRYSAQEDIVVGTPIANRTRLETESLIGFFVNTLVIRTDVSGGVNTEQLLSRVRESMLSAYQHQDLPFEKLAEVLQPTRSMSYSPLFQVMFVLQNTPQESLALPGLQVERVGTDTSNNPGLGVSKYDLTLSMIEDAEALCCKWTYNTDLFKASSIARMAMHFECLLESMLADLHCAVSQVPMLSDRESHQLLVSWQNPATDFPYDKCVHSQFELQALRTPNHVAVESATGELTYYQLNARANQLAHYLKGLGVSDGDLIGICQERSLEMIVCLLAVLKAGAIYVPLDPHLPEARFRYILDDAQCSILLMDAKFDVLAAETAKRIDVSALEEVLHGLSTDNRQSLNSTAVAYVIYTSGSTCEPKGAMVTHRNLINYFTWRQRSGLITSADRVIQKTTLSFDVAASEIFAPLLTGATIVLAPADLRHDLDTLAKHVVDLRITQLHVPPSYLKLLVDDEGFVQHHVLARLFSGGEELNASLRDRSVSVLNAKVLNGYGPTETTISVLFHDCRNSAGHSTVPIGRPVANTGIYILDANMQLLPAGHAGELYIGGEAVGAGYLYREELTAERFIDNPWGEGKLYRTGDLVRYRVDESESTPGIEFLGRLDSQIKIRGFRVELGEIEAALLAHEAI